MALTNLTAINKALSRLAEGGTPVAYPPDIVPLISAALERFALVEAAGKNAQLLRRDFSVAISSGVGDLSTALTASEPLLEEYLSSAYVLSVAGVQFHWLPDRTQLGLSRPTLIPYWTNDKATLRTRNIDGSLTSLSTTLTITGQTIPIISTVPIQVQERFIDVLAQVIKERAMIPETANAQTTVR